MKHAKTLAEIHQVTEPSHIEGKALQAFYSTADGARDAFYPPSIVLRDFLYEHAEPFRLLFASHPGAGKSTELNRLMRDTKDAFLLADYGTELMNGLQL